MNKKRNDESSKILSLPASLDAAAEGVDKLVKERKKEIEMWIAEFLLEIKNYYVKKVQSVVNFPQKVKKIHSENKEAYKSQFKKDEDPFSWIEGSVKFNAFLATINDLFTDPEDRREDGRHWKHGPKAPEKPCEKKEE